MSFELRDYVWHILDKADSLPQSNPLRLSHSSRSDEAPP